MGQAPVVSRGKNVSRSPPAVAIARWRDFGIRRRPSPAAWRRYWAALTFVRTADPAGVSSMTHPRARRPSRSSSARLKSLFFFALRAVLPPSARISAGTPPRHRWGGRPGRGRGSVELHRTAVPDRFEPVRDARPRPGCSSPQNVVSLYQIEDMADGTGGVEVVIHRGAKLLARLRGGIAEVATGGGADRRAPTRGARGARPRSGRRWSSVRRSLPASSSRSREYSIWERKCVESR